MTKTNAREEGAKAAWRTMLNMCLRELGSNDPDADRARWMSERAETVAMLRRVCGEHGDNDWPDDLHLADVIDKHLAVYFEGEP